MSEKQNPASAALSLAQKVSRWDYGKSVEKMRPLVRQWKGITGEMLRELYLAREHLAAQKGQRRDPEAPNYLALSWSGYCGEIGLRYQAVNNWLKSFQFVPKELSPTGKDALLLLDAPPKEDATAERALIQSSVAEFLRTGERPHGWRDEAEEAELKRQMKQAEYAELAQKYNAPAEAARADYFSEVMRRANDVTHFKLKDTGQMQAQLKVFKYVEAYLSTFDDSQTRALAACNLALKTRSIADKLAEEHFRLQESSAREGEG
jgi:hypothetical protein